MEILRTHFARLDMTFIIQRVLSASLLFGVIVSAISGVVAPALIAHAADPVTFIGAGDIASSSWSSSSRQERTAKIIEQAIAADPNTVVFTVGDNAYSDGTASQFAQKYDPAWGRFRDPTWQERT